LNRKNKNESSETDKLMRERGRRWLARKWERGVREEDRGENDKRTNSENRELEE
jgi:hypothetical protein